MGIIMNDFIKKCKYAIVLDFFDNLNLKDISKSNLKLKYIYKVDTSVSTPISMLLISKDRVSEKYKEYDYCVLDIEEYKNYALEIGKGKCNGFDVMLFNSYKNACKYIYDYVIIKLYDKINILI